MGNNIVFEVKKEKGKIKIEWRESEEIKITKEKKVMKQVLEIKIMTTITVLVNLGCHKRCHRLSGLNNTHIFFTVMKTKIKVSPLLVSSKDCLLGVQMATVLLCSHMVERDRGRNKYTHDSSVVFLLRRTLIPS